MQLPSTPQPMNVMSTTIGSVEDELSNRIATRLRINSVAQRYGRVMESTSGSFRVAVMDDPPTVAVYPENGSIIDSTPAFSSVDAAIVKLAGRTIASTEIVEDMADSRWNDVVDSLVNALMVGEDTLYFKGDTGQSVVGLVPAQTGGSVVVGPSTVGAITTAHLVSLMANVPSVSATPAAWYCVRSVASTLAGLEAAVGVRDGNMYLLGSPLRIVCDEAMDGIAATAGDRPLAYGHLEHAGIFVRRSQPKVSLLSELLAGLDQTIVAVRSRAGIAVTDNDSGYVSVLELA